MKADAIAQYQFVRDTLPGDPETRTMARTRAKGLGATDAELDE